MRLKQSLQSAGRQGDRARGTDKGANGAARNQQSQWGQGASSEQRGEVCLSGAVLPLLPSLPPCVLCSADV